MKENRTVAKNFMLNYIWLGLIGLAVLMGSFRGNIGDVGDAAVSSAKTAVELAGGLVGVMTLWLGLMRLADKAGLEEQRVLAIVLGRWTPSPAERDRVAAVFGLTREQIAWGHKTPIQHIYGSGPS